jgi:hypothetical protein
MPERPELWDTAELAAALGKQEATVRRWRRNGTGDPPSFPPFPAPVTTKPGPALFPEPLWDAGAVRQWGVHTGRLNRDGTPAPAPRPPARPIAPPVEVPLADGNTATVPRRWVKRFRGLDDRGNLLVTLDEGVEDYLVPLTPCCAADGKGSEGSPTGIVCRRCHRPVDAYHGGQGDLHTPRAPEPDEPDGEPDEEVP